MRGVRDCHFVSGGRGSFCVRFRFGFGFRFGIRFSLGRQFRIGDRGCVNRRFLLADAPHFYRQRRHTQAVRAIGNHQSRAGLDGSDSSVGNRHGIADDFQTVSRFICFQSQACLGVFGHGQQAFRKPDCACRSDLLHVCAIHFHHFRVVRRRLQQLHTGQLPPEVKSPLDQSADI